MSVYNRNNVAIVCGNYFNAHTIVKSLKAISFQGRIVILRQHNEPRRIADRFNLGIEEWQVKLDTSRDLPDLISVTFAPNVRKYVFLTNERFHSAMLSAIEEDKVPNLICHLGSRTHLQIILDRYEFYRFVQKNKLSAVPSTILGNTDPYTTFGDSFVVRPRISWHALNRRESVSVVRTKPQYRIAVETLRSHGLTERDWCFQEMLSVDDKHNVSICGWHGKAYKKYYCTRKVLQHPPESGDGDVVEQITAPEGMMSTTEKILNALEYEGPFELEFLLDKTQHIWKVIELNPRFWLQHGLVEKRLHYGLVRNYLLDRHVERTNSVNQPKYWINSLYALRRILKGDFRVLRYIFRNDSYMPLELSRACCYIPVYLLQRWRTHT